MSRVYAVVEGTEYRLDPERVLVRIECDGGGCEESIKPHPEIAGSGWMKTGMVDAQGRKLWEMDWCPSCYPGEPVPYPDRCACCGAVTDLTPL